MLFKSYTKHRRALVRDELQYVQELVERALVPDITEMELKDLLGDIAKYAGDAQNELVRLEGYRDAMRDVRLARSFSARAQQPQGATVQ
jgi:hypothetical protein